MMKDCFKQAVVDAQKFRECARCPIYEECTQSVYLGGARGAARVGRFLGFALGIIGLLVGAMEWSDLPNGAPWLLLVCLVYLIAVYKAGKDYGLRNQEEAMRALHSAEAKPAEAAAPKPAH